MKGVVKKSWNNLNEKISSLNFGQFLFLYFLGRNVDYNTYKKILEGLADKKSEEMIPSITEGPTAPPMTMTMLRKLSKPDM